MDEALIVINDHPFIELTALTKYREIMINGEIDIVIDAEDPMTRAGILEDIRRHTKATQIWMNPFRDQLAIGVQIEGKPRTIAVGKTDAEVIVRAIKWAEEFENG